MEFSRIMKGGTVVGNGGLAVTFRNF